MDTSKPNHYEYLIVDHYFKTFIEINTLATAFKLNIIDYIIKNSKCTIDDISNETSISDKGLGILFNILISYEILQANDKYFSFTKNFERVLKYRDLLESKLKYIKLVYYDILKNFTKVIKENYSVQQWEIMKFWQYTSKKQCSKEELIKVKRWIKFVSTLTKYDSLGCIYNYDFSIHRNILDIGGNSGEFALQICKHFDNIKISVFDLPIVCNIGKEHLRNFEQKNRIDFIEGDIRTDEIPENFDLIMFKSMLHDWQKDEVTLFLKKAYDSLKKGERILIYEFEKIDLKNTKLLDKNIMWLTFLNNFRKPKDYHDILNKLKFKDIEVNKLSENNFFLITAKK